MGIKDFWRKHQNKKIAKKDEKLLKRLQEINIDPDDLRQAPVVLVQRPENDELLTRMNDLEKRFEEIQKRNFEDFEENWESEDEDEPGPSANANETRKPRIQPVQINNYYLVPGNELNALTNQQNSINPDKSAEEIEVQRKRDQEREDEKFARRLQLELEQEDFLAFRREREERTRLATRLATLAEDEEEVAQRRQIDEDAEFAWSLHFREETTNETLEPNDELPTMASTLTSGDASTSQREALRSENNPVEVPEFIRKATEIQQRLAGHSTPKGGSTSTSTVRQDGNSSSADRGVNEEEVQAINEQIENDAALAKALAEAENEFFERHHLGTRNRHSIGNNEQLKRFTELVPMLFSDSELNDESDDESEGNEDLEKEIVGERLSTSEDHCVICLEAEVVDAVGCAKCRQLLGCRRCVLNWYRGGTGDDFSTALWFVVAGDQNYKSCPLCRVQWGNQPELINLQHRF